MKQRPLQMTLIFMPQNKSDSRTRKQAKQKPAPQTKGAGLFVDYNFQPSFIRPDSLYNHPLVFARNFNTAQGHYTQKVPTIALSTPEKSLFEVIFDSLFRTNIRFTSSA